MQRVFTELMSASVELRVSLSDCQHHISSNNVGLVSNHVICADFVTKEFVGPIPDYFIDEFSRRNRKATETYKSFIARISLYTIAV